MTKANESKEVFNITNINVVIPVVNWYIINKVEVSNLIVRNLINFTITICNNYPSNATEVDMLFFTQ